MDPDNPVSVDKLTCIVSLSDEKPPLQPDLNYSSSALELVESLTYFEYRRLKFDEDLGYASPNHVTCLNASINDSENGLEQKVKPRYRISTANNNFQLCPSYPRFLIVPAEITDDELKSVASFRNQNRLPVITWRYYKNGCVIARSSQPYVGLWGSRSDTDEKLLHLIATSSMVLSRAKHKSATIDQQDQKTDEANPDIEQETNNEEKHESNISRDEIDPIQKSMMVVDCRSYTVAMVNRAKGGGCECTEYYPYCDIQFMGLANIHSIRKSFDSLRYLQNCDMYSDAWENLLSGSKWLHYISCILKSAVTISEAIEDDRSCLVHCSDGWDRTPQLVSLVQLMLDPYYRTYDGFRVLIEKEWIEFGHKFADRHGVMPEDDNSYEKCPIFQQWLDCVYQIVRQHSDAFEFNILYLQSILYHSYASLYGTFVGNSLNHKAQKNIFAQTSSLWPYLQNEKHCFINNSYVPKTGNNNIVTPSTEVRDLRLWVEVYCPSSSDMITLSDIQSSKI